MSKFTFTGTRTNGIKDGIRTEWYTKFEAITKAAEFFNLPYTGVIDRPDLQVCAGTRALVHVLVLVLVLVLGVAVCVCVYMHSVVHVS